MSHDRQTIMEANRSLRTIKNELENLLEKGVIDDTVYESIHASLPQESPLSGPLRTTASSNAATPVRSPAPSAASATNPPTQAFANLDVKSRSPPPPSYNETPAPSLPARANAKPIVAHARALYQYNASDGRDLAFQKDDKISVYEYMNNDWWMGLNTRTGLEGIFPKNYVFVENHEKSPAPTPAPVPQPQYGYPTNQGPPQQQNPYNSSVPPMAVSEGGQPSDPSKAQQYGKKFGKKLGNAAIFGAGASIGGKIVNGIF